MAGDKNRSHSAKVGLSFQQKKLECFVTQEKKNSGNVVAGKTQNEKNTRKTMVNQNPHVCGFDFEVGKIGGEKTELTT